jgi:hypothetical protein
MKRKISLINVIILVASLLITCFSQKVPWGYLIDNIGCDGTKMGLPLVFSCYCVGWCTLNQKTIYNVVFSCLYFFLDWLFWGSMLSVLIQRKNWKESLKMNLKINALSVLILMIAVALGLLLSTIARR